MNFAARDDTKVTATVLRAYNFESDNEDNINTDDLSDLSDAFEEVINEPIISGNRSNLNESAISLDDITYDRDLKYINVPNGGRSKPVILQNNRLLLKQVRNITDDAAAELNQLDQHYTDMDNRKRDHDKKFLVEFDTDHSGRAKDGRSRRGSVRGRGRRGSAERPESSGKSGMEEDNTIEGLDRGYDVDIVDREIKSSRRRGLGNGQRGGGGRGLDGTGGRETRAPKAGRSDPRGRQEGRTNARDSDARVPKTEPHTSVPEQQHDGPHAPVLQGYEQHLEREYADYIQATPSAFSPYATEQVRPGRGHRVHPRAVPYQHPNAPQQQAYQPDSRHSAPRRHQPRDAHPSHYQPQSGDYAYAHDDYEAPLDQRYSRPAPAYPTYQSQPAYPPQRLFVPSQYQQGHRGQQPPVPPHHTHEPKLNAKAVEFVPNWG